MTDFNNAKEQLEHKAQDMRILRYLITYAERVHSTAAKGSLVHYIYVQPGMFDNIIGISNIDFVQQVYALNGINLKKHLSHLDDKETEVLFITAEDYLNLGEAQQKFLSVTAPLNYLASQDAKERAVNIVNLMMHTRNKAQEESR